MFRFLQPLSFAAYLSHPSVNAKLCSNVHHFFDKELDSNAISSISRLLNDLPGKYRALTPLLDTLKNVDGDVFLGKWFDFAYAVAITDLFDNHANIKADVYAALNIKTTSHPEQGVLDRLNAKFGTDVVKAHLLSAYLVFLSSDALKVLREKFPDRKWEDMTRHPVTRYNIISQEKEQVISDCFGKEFNLETMTFLWSNARNIAFDQSYGETPGDSAYTLRLAIYHRLKNHIDCKPVPLAPVGPSERPLV